MGGIFQHALNMLLEEDRTFDEIVERAVERYEMKEEMARFHLGLEMVYYCERIECKNGKYRKKRDLVNPADIVQMFDNMSDTYFDNRPGMYALYVDCRVKARLF